MWRFLSKIILSLSGWTIRGAEDLIPLKKFVVAIGPHTSNWDFPLGILVRSAAGLTKIRFIGKDSLFTFPFGFIFRALGGYPVVRSERKNQVESYSELFNLHDEFAIVIAPEGTRKKVDRLKTGFYHIARMANVPIVPASIDYQIKEVRFYEAFYPGPDAEQEIMKVARIIGNARAKYPEKAYRL